MKFISIICLAATASAVRLEGQAKGFFEVMEFGAQHIPHSEDAVVSFNVSATAAGLASTNCFNNTVGLGSNGLANAQAICADNETSFSFDMLAGHGFQLKIRHGALHGKKHFPKRDVAYFESPPGSGFEWEYLNTSGTFDVKYH